MALYEVPRVSVDGLTPERFFAEYVVQNQPVVITDLLHDCPAKQWTIDSLEKRAGASSAVIPVAPLSPSRRSSRIESVAEWPLPDAPEPLDGVLHADRLLVVSAAPVCLPFCEVLASLRSALENPKATTFYSDGASKSNVAVGEPFDFLREDLPQAPQVGAHLIPKSTHLWLGGQTVSTLHVDNIDSLFCQLVGGKRFLLVPPADTEKLVDGRLRKAFKTWTGAAFSREADGLSKSTVMNYAAYDIHAPLPAYEASAASLRRVHVTVCAGEMLYIPFGWWHEVTSVPCDGLCASFTFIFEPLFVRVQPKHWTKLGPLSINPKYRRTLDDLGLASVVDDEDEAAAPGVSGEVASMPCSGAVQCCMQWSDLVRALDGDPDVAHMVLQALDGGYLVVSGIPTAAMIATHARCVFDVPGEFEPYKSLGNGKTIGYREDGNASFLECRLLQTTVASRTMAKLQPVMPAELAKPLQVVFGTRLLVAHSVLSAIAVALDAPLDALTSLIDPVPQSVYVSAGLKMPRVSGAQESRQSRQLQQRLSSSALRLCKYDPGCTFGAHTDTTMMTISTGARGAQNASGLEMKLAEGWMSAEQVSSDDVLIWPGDFLAALTKHRIRSTIHRVPPRDETRFSATVLIRIDPDAVLSHESVAGSQLLQSEGSLHGSDLRQFVEAKRKLVAKSQDPDDDYSLDPFHDSSEVMG